VTLCLGEKVSASQLDGYDEVILACGISPRLPEIEGIDHPSVLTYLDVLRDKKPVGQRVAIIGAGGIGFDTAEYLVQSGPSASLDSAAFSHEWGIDQTLTQRGGLSADGPQAEPAAREVVLLQRKSSKVGAGLGKTTGWIHRASLLQRGVTMCSGVTYERIDNDGLHITRDGVSECLAVDNVIICAGQEPQRALHEPLLAAGKSVHLIGGADVALELDARRAIDQGTRLAMAI
jgi:2,4-dienoyl-CoA reductase (NADPH2)